MLNQTSSPHWNFPRFGQVVKNLALQHYRSWLLIAATVNGLYLLLSLIPHGLLGSLQSPATYFGQVASVIGLFTAAQSFAPLHQPGSSLAWFLVPASLIEKFVAAVLLPIGFSLLALPLLGLVTSGLAQLLNQALFQYHGSSFDPLSSEFMSRFWFTLGAIPIAVYGSLIFRRQPLIKTLLIGLGIVSLTLGLITLLVWLFFTDGQPLHAGIVNGGIALGNLMLDLDTWQPANLYGAILIDGVVPLAFLAAAWFRLTEFEVKDGLS